MWILTPPRRGAMPFGRFMLNPTGKFACYGDAGGCAGRRVPANRASQDGKVLAAELEKKMVTQVGVRRAL